MGVRNMGETIRLLAIDDNSERISRISEQLSKQDPTIKIEHPLDLKSFIQRIETNSYDGIIITQEISELNRTVFIHKLALIIDLPVINYLRDIEPHDTNQNRDHMNEEDMLSFKLLATRINQILRIRSKSGDRFFSPFPDTPKVIVRGKELFIMDDDGLEEFWGIESPDEIMDIAAKMEMELRAFKWVKDEVHRFLDDLTEVLGRTDIPSQKIPSIIFEGYRSLLFSFKKIDESINRS